MSMYVPYDDEDTEKSPREDRSSLWWTIIFVGAILTASIASILFILANI